MSKDFFTDINLSQEKASSYSLPDLIVKSDKLIKFSYNNQTQKYESQAVANLEETPSLMSFWRLVALSDSIFVGQNIDQRLNRRLNQEQTDRPQSKVIKLSASLEKLQVYECTNVAAIATDGNHIFICTDGKLIALNQDLETLDEVNLELLDFLWGGEKKNAHDILIYQSIAYLLDNVVSPTYVLRVDISNPNNLQILSTFHISGINHHLRTQWINPDLNQWCILQSYSTQGGSGENIIILPLDVESGSVDIGQSQFSGYTKISHLVDVDLDKLNFDELDVDEFEFLCSDPKLNKSSILRCQSINQTSFDRSKKSGFELVAVTSFPPVWGIIYEISEQIHLAKIETSNNNVNFQKKLYLGEFKDYDLKVRITSVDRLLFLVIEPYTNQRSFTRLLIIDVAQEPSIILNQNLEVQGLYNFTISPETPLGCVTFH
ncbi:MAG: hypothetical protein F6K40_33575 [Okeania sp. SIO3I5]|uniref:hypothetical protein n=1 Tax=Okeania sp. SIO3I5 TaxID=2607805 RepID=UPI0013BCFAC0|nr:hypothetical protein [Okeania sp. SIO3I5]NEQ40885.1 hypothetical protein [Okeania sp. SIO3I5]